jgi:DNA-binding transcriptional MerR regulator
MVETEALLNDVKAAKFLGMSVFTLRYWRTIGKGPATVKMEGRVRYDKADLLAYIDANRSAGSSVRASIGG